MYIYLDESILNLNLENPDNLCKVEFLLTGYAEGNYILNAPRKLLKFFFDNSSLSRIARDAAVFAYKNYSMMNAFLEKIPYKIIVKDKSNINNSDNQWIISLTDVKYGFLVNGIVILGENLNDSKFLNFTAQHFQKTSNDYKPFILINHFHGGGGSTTYNELDNLLNRKLNHIFCFLDSDKESPTCLDTDTAKKCIRSINKNSWLSKFSSTNDYREAENLIPLSLLEKIEQFPLSNIQKIKQIEGKHQVLLYPYIDIKNGLTKKFLTKISQTQSQKKEFWHTILQKIALEGIPIECNIVNDICTIHTQLKDNVCQILPAGTQKTLESTIKVLEKMPIDESFNIIKDDYSSKAWFEIGETIFWLSCALPKIRLS
ncbi:hypothetical protein ACG94X_13360 [Acinetobacter sp. ULE_I010]|uniref:hypothetical protein n=1 Tax=Acinetobacter sp. ULE_I010 TaxID=3373065 RepID=UPI003AF960DD